MGFGGVLVGVEGWFGWTWGGIWWLSGETVGPCHKLSAKAVYELGRRLVFWGESGFLVGLVTS